jgi:WD40 repeat protein
MKQVLLIVMFAAALYAQKIQMPQAVFETSGGTTDLLVKNEKLYVATDAGCVDIFEIQTQKKLQSVCVEKIVDFMGDPIDSKIYSIDIVEGRMLLLSQADGGFRRLHLYEDGKLKEIIAKDAMLSIARAKFLDPNRIVIALLGSELLLYDIQAKSFLYEIQVSQSKFSHFVLDESKNRVVIADESGALKIHDTKSGKLLQTLRGQNLDNVFQIDMKNERIITAGQDRRVVVYNLKNASPFYVTSSFLVYTAALSPSGKLGAYSSDEHNNVTVFATDSQAKLGVFGNNKMTLTNILFSDENHFFVGSDDKKVHFYSIP